MDFFKSHDNLGCYLLDLSDVLEADHFDLVVERKVWLLHHVAEELLFLVRIEDLDGFKLKIDNFADEFGVIEVFDKLRKSLKPFFKFEVFKF